MNVITGTFVQGAITYAQEVKEQQNMMQARLLFKELDEDSSGFISFDEIEKHLESQAVQEYFKMIDVDPSEAKHLFEMLDINDSGEIDLEEFLSGCLRLQGPAKALDLLLVTRENRRFFEHAIKVLQ